MPEIKYVVPTLAGSRWDTPSARHWADRDWPRLGIFCRHHHELWLVGSFALSNEVLRQRGERLWGWEPRYQTGDGYLIHLDKVSGAGESQQLVSDRPRDREDEAAARRRAVDLLAAGDFEAAQSLSDSLDADQATLRLRIPLQCPPCGIRRVFRSDTVQSIVETFSAVGIPEIGLREFMARVDNRGRVR